METRAHHVLIGFFTFLVVGAVLMFALWLGKSDDKQFRTYDVVFQEAVTGLSKGSTVEFNGIKIGDVSSLRLDPQDPRRVFARVRVDAQAPVRSDTRARLVPAGITGMSIIRLSSGNEAGSAPLEGKDGQVPVIVATPSPLSKMLADGEDVMLNVNQISMQARDLFSAENVASFGRMLRNLEEATGAVAAQREDMGRALKELARASAQADMALGEAAKVAKATSRVIDERGAQTLQSAQGAMDAFERAMQKVDTLISENRGQLATGVRGTAEIGPTLVELQDTLASLRAISRQLENRPADYLLGNEPVREFKP